MEWKQTDNPALDIGHRRALLSGRVDTFVAILHGLKIPDWCLCSYRGDLNRATGMVSSPPAYMPIYTIIAISSAAIPYCGSI